MRERAFGYQLYQVIDQAEGVADGAARELGFVLGDLVAIPDQWALEVVHRIGGSAKCGIQARRRLTARKKVGN